MRFTYPVTLTPDEVDGGFVVTFPDLPEAITQGDSMEECLTEAADCLEEAMAARISDGLDIPEPSAPGELVVSLPLEMALKASVYLAMREEGLSKSDLARRLELDEKEARRILDPHHHTKLPTLEKALKSLGKRIDLRVA